MSSSSSFDGNVAKAQLYLARSLEAGMVWVNSENNRHLPTLGRRLR